MFGDIRVFGAVIAVFCICMTSVSSAEDTVAEGDEMPATRELVSAYIKANGGLGNIQGVTSIAASGKVILTDGEPQEFKLYLKRPNLIRVQFRGEGGDYSKIYNGKEAFEMYSNELGEIATRPLSQEVLEEFRLDANVDGRFFQLRDEYEVIEVVGLTEVNGEPAYELLIGEEAESVFQRIWLHEEYLYELKMSRMLENAEGPEILEELYMSDFEQVRGVWTAKKVARHYDGQLVQEIVFDRVRANVGLYDSFFDKPKPKSE